jgi:hypothetical protein
MELFAKTGIKGGFNGLVKDCLLNGKTLFLIISLL